MIDIKPVVYKTVNETIKDLHLCNKIHLYWIAPKVGDTLPCMVYNEIENNDYERVLGAEYANITIQFTNYVDSEHPEDLIEMANIVDTAMCERLGFRKSYSGEIMFKEGLYSQVIRFTGVVNHHKMIFKS